MQLPQIKALHRMMLILEFPKIGGTLFWGPYNEDPTIWGTRLGSPIFGNSHIGQSGPAADQACPGTWRIM